VQRKPRLLFQPLLLLPVHPFVGPAHNSLRGSNVRQRFSATLSGNFPSGFSESNL